jgi:predicted Zn-dependent protease
MRLAASCLLGVLLLAACSVPTSKPPEISAEDIRREEEVQQRMIDEATKNGGIQRPWRKRKNINKRFEQVAERMEAAAADFCRDMELPSRKRRCYYYFETSRSREINAFADGDRIVVTQGMLRFLENDDELALVMGHELAHNLMGHIDAKKDNAVGGHLLGAMMDGMAASYGGYSGNDWQNLGAAVTSLSHSQSFEAEADYVGLYITARAGYDISNAIDMWRRWSVEDPEGLYVAITHPTKPERFARLTKAIEEIQGKKKRHEALLPNMNGAPKEGKYATDPKLW